MPNLQFGLKAPQRPFNTVPVEHAFSKDDFAETRKIGKERGRTPEVDVAEMNLPHRRDGHKVWTQLNGGRDKHKFSAYEARAVLLGMRPLRQDVLLGFQDVRGKKILSC